MILASIAIASAVRFDSAEPEGDDVSRSDERQSTPRWQPRIHIVKKRHGKVRQIHVYPMKPRYSQRGDHRPSHTVSETHEHVGYVDPKDQEHTAAESSKVEKMIDVDGSESHHNDNHIGESHHFETKQRIKIKHHHHHHHHNHVKTVVKKEPYPVEKIIQVKNSRRKPEQHYRHKETKCSHAKHCYKLFVYDYSMTIAGNCSSLSLLFDCFPSPLPNLPIVAFNYFDSMRTSINQFDFLEYIYRASVTLCGLFA